MAKLYILLFIFLFTLFSCGTSATQKTDTESSPPPKDKDSALNLAPKVQRSTNGNNQVLPFDPSAITPEQFKTTKNEIINFVYELNTIIRTQNYEKWVSFLDTAYYKTISSKDFLEERSNTEILRSKNIVLENPRDYFFNVVVPSRAKDRVDDIAFVSGNRVKAFTVVKGQRLRLYDLEKRDGRWFILN